MRGNIGFGFEFGHFLQSARHADRESPDHPFIESYRYNMIHIIKNLVKAMGNQNIFYVQWRNGFGRSVSNKRHL